MNPLAIVDSFCSVVVSERISWSYHSEVNQAKNRFAHALYSESGSYYCVEVQNSLLGMSYGY